METRSRYERSNMSEQMPKIAILEALQISHASEISDDDLINRIRVLMEKEESKEPLTRNLRLPNRHSHQKIKIRHNRILEKRWLKISRSHHLRLKVMFRR